MSAPRCPTRGRVGRLAAALAAALAAVGLDAGALSVLMGNRVSASGIDLPAAFADSTAVSPGDATWDAEQLGFACVDV